MNDCKAVLFECAELENRLLYDMLDENFVDKAKRTIYRIIVVLYNTILAIIDKIHIELNNFKSLEDKWSKLKIREVRHVKVSKRVAGTWLGSIFSFFEDELETLQRYVKHNITSNRDKDVEGHYSIFLARITDFEEEKINKDEFVKKLNEYFQSTSPKKYYANEVEMDDFILKHIQNGVRDIDGQDGYLTKLRLIKTKTKIIYKHSLNSINSIYSGMIELEDKKYAASDLKNKSKAALSAEMLALNTLHKYIIDYYKELVKIDISKPKED